MCEGRMVQCVLSISKEFDAEEVNSEEPEEEPYDFFDSLSGEEVDHINEAAIWYFGEPVVHTNAALPWFGDNYWDELNALCKEHMKR